MRELGWNIKIPILKVLEEGVRVRMKDGNENAYLKGKNDEELLYFLQKSLYSNHDTNEIIMESINYFNILFPEEIFEFWLSQDYKILSKLIKFMNMALNNDDIKDQAFIKGKYIINKDIGEFAIPIRGRQAIYGVVYLKSVNFKNIFNRINFLNEIVEIIANAFENSLLYQQSNDMVRRLESINSLTKKINNSLNKDDVINVVISELNNIYSSQFIIFAELNEEKDKYINVKNNLGKEIDYIPVENTYIGLVYKRKEAIIIGDRKKDYGLGGNYCTQSSCNSIIAVPIFIRNVMIGALSVTSVENNYFSFDDLKFLELLSQQFSLALTNSLMLNQIQELAITDYLTNLFNRSYLDEKIKGSQLEDKGGTLLLFDLDNFKRVNDNYGHQVGDKILIMVANIFKNNIREDDVAARWGGEELAIYLPKADENLAVKIGERIVKMVREETDPKVTISCGVASWKIDDNEIDYLQLVRKADQALYEAKGKGKDQLIIYSR